MGVVPARALVALLALLLVFPSAAFASLPDEERRGQALAGQLQSGSKSCSDLSSEDFDHIGEYVMGHFLGSTAAHEAMNERMRLMMGEQAEGRMHQLMGARFVGCTAAGGSAGSYGYGPMMGGAGMMGGYSGNGGWGAMMRSGGYSWMTGGAWRNMSRADWQRLQHQWLGTSALAGRGGGWSAGAIVAVALGSALLAAVLAILLVRRRPLRRPRAADSPS